MKLSHKTLKIITLITSFIIIGFFTKTEIIALSTEYPSYDIEINIEKNTKFTVTEKLELIFTGELNGARRDITLVDEEKNQFCAKYPSYTCGGFEFLLFKGMSLNGEKLAKKDYNLYITSDTFLKSFRVEKRIKDPAEYVVNDDYKWEFSYDVYGGIQRVLSSDDTTRVPFFYWNVFPEGRSGPIERATLKLKFPSDVEIDLDKFSWHSYLYESLIETEYNESDNSVLFTLNNVPAGEFTTLSYEFAEDDLLDVASVNFEYERPSLGSTLFFEDFKIEGLQDNSLDYIPSGNFKIAAERAGYKSQIFDLNLRPGETDELKINLAPTIFMQALILLNNALFVAGIGASVIAPYYVYRKWYLKGRDKGKIETIIPQFSPPENIRPYLLGSIKDEKVDKRDISGTIIDLAYRGFIHIKEVKKNKEYELTKKEGKPGEQLDEIEQELIKDLFGNKETINTKNMQSVTFYTAMHTLTKDIYQKMKDDGYFEENPEKTRGNYAGIGVLLFILGIVVSIGGSILFTTLIGEISFLTIGIAGFIVGIGFILISQHMPAKTQKGSKLYGDIRGFKMYLETAERFRVQNLVPEQFEKYLSYAIVFGVEKQWAKNFKDIYKQTPDWYEGSDITDALVLSSFTRSFASTTESTFTPSSSSSGFGSGGGWSGGGSSGGGFSGGGGGGGSAGGW